MKHKSRCFSVMLFLAVILCVPVSILWPQTHLLRGDVTRDGLIDGRDALRILQHIEGVITLSDDQIAQGDVYPLPDGNGSASGDGVLSQEDALTILRIGVGLMTAGDISNNFNESPPVIDDFEPQSVVSGEMVTITGSNFPAAHPKETLLLIGTLPVDILSIENTAIQFQVPETAQSGTLRLFTPGGSAESSHPLFILKGTQGVLKLEANANPQDYMVFTPHDAVEIENADGLFTLHFPMDTMVLIAASSTAEKRPGIYLYLRLPDEAASSQPFQIDAISTAKALIFFHPFLSTKDPNGARYLFDLMEQTPEVQTLADIIAQRYPLGADGLDDPEVGSAWEVATSVLLNKAIQNQAALRPNLSVSGKTTRSRMSNQSDSSRVSSSRSTQETVASIKPMAEDTGDLPVYIYGIDALFIAPEYIPEKNGIKMKLDNYSPIDWVSTLYRLDPNDMPRGINESFLSLRSRGVQTTGYEISTVVPANQWTAKIDLLYYAVDWSINSILEKFVEGGNVLPFDNASLSTLEDSVYLLNSYSGSLYTGLEKEKPDFAAIKSLPSGNTMANYSTGINITIAAVDLWDLLTGESKRWTRAATKKGIQNAVRKISQRLSNVDIATISARDFMSILLDATIEAVKGALTSAPQGVITWSHKKLGDEAQEKLKQAQGKLQKTCLQCMSRANAVLGALDKISSLGRVAERLLGLIGRLINVYDLELSEAVSPLESHLVVVGDPFSPTAISMTPSEGAPGSEITILGKRFAPKPEDNTVFFGGKEAKVLSVQQREKLVVVVPEGLTYNYDQQVRVETPAMMKAAVLPTKFTVKRIPRITAVTPLRIFPSVPGDDPGPWVSTPSVLSIKGSGFQSTTSTPDRVFLGNQEITDLYFMHSEIRVTMPANMAPGKYRVSIISSENNGYVAVGPEITVIDKPIVQSVFPDEARAGQYVTVTGMNFGTNRAEVMVGEARSPEIKKSSETEIIFRMPTAGNPGETLPIRVYTPSGSSGVLNIKRAAGFEDALAPGQRGFSITVNSYKSGVQPDGQLTLDEAANIARGDLDPFSGSWDDKNEEWIHHYYQLRRYSDDQKPYYIWQENTISKEIKESGPGFEVIEHYRVDHYHSDNGGSVSDKYYVNTESLDSPGNREEGDFVISDSPDGRSGGRDYADTISVHYEMTSGDTFHAVDLILGDYDSLSMPPESVLSLGGRGIQITNGSTLHLGKVACELGDVITVKGLKNTINAHITDSGGNGIVMEEAVGTDVRGVIENCNGHGLWVKSGGDNHLYVHVRQAGKNGIFIEESHQNRIGIWFQKHIIEKGLSHGIYLKNAKQTHISELVVSENQGDGIVLDNSSLSDFYNLQLAGNDSGITLFGPQTRDNALSSIYIGYINTVFSEDNQNMELMKMHKKHGLHLYDKASQNQIGGVYIFQTGDHGILIEDEGTSGNSIGDTHVGMPFNWDSLPNGESIPWPSASGADGLVVRKGAARNIFKRMSISHQAGNGITIQDAGTDFNTFDTVHTGLYMESNKANKELFKNDGWGAVIQEGPRETLFSNCYAGFNEEGGYLVDSNRLAAPDTIHNITFTSCYAGYSLDSNFKPKHSIDELTLEYEFDFRQRSGFALRDCTNVYVDRCYTWGYVFGVAITGEWSANNSIWSGLYRDALHAGVYVHKQFNPHQIQNASFMECRAYGILVSECLNQSLLGCRSSGFNETKDTGINLRIEDSELILVDNASFGNSLQNSVEIDASHSITFLNFWTNQAGYNGVMIRGSQNIIIENPEISSNYYHGIYIVDAKDVTIQAGRIGQNILSGISVEHSANVHVNEVFIYSNSEHGITIDGELSDNVVVLGSYIVANAKNGIYASQGKGIRIGDPWGGEEQRNYFEDNEVAGIHAEGNDTEIIIANNHIGTVYDSDSFLYTYGNKAGILLSNGIHDALIQKNSIKFNDEDGIYLHEGASENYINNNEIHENGGHGVHVDGNNTIRNTITMNSITNNGEKGIALINGGNESIQPPVIDKVTWMGDNIWGEAAAPDQSIIEVFFDADEEGEFMAGVGRVFKERFNVAGGYDPSMQLHGTVTDPNGNTSEFGPTEIPPERSDAFVYTDEQNGGMDIYYKPTGNALPIQLTTDPAADYSPFASSDGSSIFFVSERQGNPDVWMYKTSSGEVSPLTTSSAAEIDPCLEPNGENLVYASNESGKFNIYRMLVSSNGSGNSVAFTNGPVDSGISALKDSQYATRILTEKAGVLDKISFFIQRDPTPFAWSITDWNIYEPGENIFAEGTAAPTEAGWFEMDIEDLSLPADFAIHVKMLEDNRPGLGKAPAAMGMFSWTYFLSSLGSWNTLGMEIMLKAEFVSIPPQLLTHNDGDNRHPAVSSDGNQIAYTSNADGNYDIWIMNLDGSDPRKITDGQGSNTQPVWNSDNQGIVFTSDRDGQSDLYQINMDGSGLVRVTQNQGFDGDPAWSLDGKRLLFTSERDAGKEIYSIISGETRIERQTFSTSGVSQPHAAPAMTVSAEKSNSTIVSKTDTGDGNLWNRMAAPTELRVEVTPAKAKPGETVELVIQAVNAENLGNVTFDIGFDPGVLNLSDMTLSLTFQTGSLHVMNPESLSDVDGFVRWNWIHAHGASGDPEIMSLNFIIDGNADSETTYVKLSNVRWFDADLYPLNIQPANIPIVIEKENTVIEHWSLYE